MIRVGARLRRLGVYRVSGPFWRNHHINMSSSSAKGATQTPKVVSSAEMPTSEAKWITLKKLKYTDATGSERLWECAERKTRKSSGIDAVAILPIIRSEKNAFPLSTVVIEQFRPPTNQFVVELPAGLIDDNETAEQAAFRELEEETGYKASSVIQVSPVQVADPGMTNANLKLVILSVVLPDEMTYPEQKLDAGEFITCKIVELDKLEAQLEEYAKKGFAIDAKLSHYSIGYSMAHQISGGKVF